MKLNKLTILILIAIIAGLSLVIPIREKQHSKTMTEYIDLAIQKDEARLETYNEFTANYNDLYRQYNELYGKYMERYIHWQNFTVTAYTQYDEGCNNITAIGLDLNKDWTKHFNFVAVDPEIIDYGKTVFIKLDGKIIEALAVDCGYKIKGNRLDLYHRTLDEAFGWGEKEDVPVGWIND